MVRTSVFSFVLFSLSALAQEGEEIPVSNEPSAHPAPTECQSTAKQNQFNIRHQEGTGVGYNKGYTSANALLNYKINQQFFSFLDLRGHIFNDGKWAANAGLGLRYLPNALSILFGINAFYDYRETKHSVFNQLGAGFECFLPHWDIRVNGYFPFGTRKHHYKKGFDRFEGHNAFLFEKVDSPFLGGDARVGRRIYKNDELQLYGTAGAYYFYGQYGKNSCGALLNLKATISKYLTVEGQTSYDSTFHWRGYGEIGLQISFGGKHTLKRTDMPCKNMTRLQQKLIDKVDRFEIIVADIHKKHARARDPISGLPFNFIFVDNQRGSSDGSFGNPFRTLAQAQANSQPGDIIYVFPGDGTDNGMNVGISLQNNQQLLSSAVAIPVSSTFGSLTIPAQTFSKPFISNYGAVNNVINLANNNEVRGFNITASGLVGFQAIDGTNGTLNVTISENNINANGTIGINLSALSGNALISQNFINDGGGTGINFNAQAPFFTATISNNSFTSNSLGFGFLIDTLAGTAAIDILNNTFSNHFQGISATTRLGNIGSLSFLINNNTGINENTMMTLQVFGGSINATINNNQILSPSLNGINIIAEIASNNFNIGGNFIFNAADDGILIQSNTSGIINARLFQNVSTSITGSGYNLMHTSPSELNIQSFKALLSGVANTTGVDTLNIGTISSAGTITFVPVTINPIPYSE